MEKQSKQKQIGFWSALGVMLFLIFSISVQVFVLGSTSTTQITLILVTAVAAMVAMLHGFSWDELK